MAQIFCINLSMHQIEFPDFRSFAHVENAIQSKSLPIRCALAKTLAQRSTIRETALNCSSLVKSITFVDADRSIKKGTYNYIINYNTMDSNAKLFQF